MNELNALEVTGNHSGIYGIAGDIANTRCVFPRPPERTLQLMIREGGRRFLINCGLERGSSTISHQALKLTNPRVCPFERQIISGSIRTLTTDIPITQKQFVSGERNYDILPLCAVNVNNMIVCCQYRISPYKYV